MLNVPHANSFQRRSFLKKAVGTGLATALSSCLPSAKQSAQRLTLAHGLSTDHPVHKAMAFMGKRLEKLSSGRLGVDIFPNGQLGDERQLIELLQIGAVAITKVSALSMEGFSPKMRLFSLPYLFTDNTHYWRVLESQLGRELLASLSSQRLEGLGYYDAGSRSFYMTNRAIQTPSDLKGLKIRVLPSRTSIAMIEAMGGSATPISWGELYTALQQGVVDGAENNPPSYHLSRHYEAAKFYSLDEHTSVPDLVIISRPVFESLSDEARDWLREAMSDSVSFQRTLWSAATESALSAVERAGVKVIKPDKAPFRQAVAPLKASFIDTDLGGFISRVEAMEA